MERQQGTWSRSFWNYGQAANRASSFGAMMPNLISDREYVLRILDAMEGKPNNSKAKKISALLGVRIRQRLGARKNADSEDSGIPQDE
jgi:hypothetical protein